MEKKRQDVDDIFKGCSFLEDKSSFIKLRQAECLEELMDLNLSKEEVFYFVEKYQVPPSTILHKIEYCGKNLSRFSEKFELKRQMTIEDAMQFSNDVEFMNESYTKIPFILVAHAWFLGKGIL